MKKSRSIICSVLVCPKVVKLCLGLTTQDLGGDLISWWPFKLKTRHSLPIENYCVRQRLLTIEVSTWRELWGLFKMEEHSIIRDRPIMVIKQGLMEPAVQLEAKARSTGVGQWRTTRRRRGVGLSRGGGLLWGAWEPLGVWHTTTCNLNWYTSGAVLILCQN